MLKINARTTTRIYSYYMRIIPWATFNYFDFI